MNRLLFAVVRTIPSWVLIPLNPWHDLNDDQYPQIDKMLFVSNFNGTWDQYIDDLCWHS